MSRRARVEVVIYQVFHFVLKFRDLWISVIVTPYNSANTMVAQPASACSLSFQPINPFPVEIDSA